MNAIIRRSATTLAAVTLGFGALTASSGGASALAHTATGAGWQDNCQKVSDCTRYPRPRQVTPPKGLHPNWIPGNNDPRDIPTNCPPCHPRGSASA